MSIAAPSGCLRRRHIIHFSMSIVDIAVLFLVDVVLVVVICLILLFYNMPLLLVLLINCIGTGTRCISKQLAFD
jgi:hypothetical protein